MGTVAGTGSAAGADATFGRGSTAGAGATTAAALFDCQRPIAKPPAVPRPANSSPVATNAQAGNFFGPSTDWQTPQIRASSGFVWWHEGQRTSDQGSHQKAGASISSGWIVQSPLRGSFKLLRCVFRVSGADLPGEGIHGDRL
jgi:hypothetical protein